MEDFCRGKKKVLFNSKPVSLMMMAIVCVMTFWCSVLFIPRLNFCGKKGGNCQVTAVAWCTLHKWGSPGFPTKQNYLIFCTKAAKGYENKLSGVQWWRKNHAVYQGKMCCLRNAVGIGLVHVNQQLGGLCCVSWGPAQRWYWTAKLPGTCSSQLFTHFFFYTFHSGWVLCCL